MANVKANRLANFELLIKEAGSIIELSRRAGYNKPAYLYQVHAQREKANGTTMQIGKRVAQRLEEAMGKPAGWMDQDHSAAAGGRIIRFGARPLNQRRQYFQAAFFALNRGARQPENV